MEMIKTIDEAVEDMNMVIETLSTEEFKAFYNHYQSFLREMNSKHIDIELTDSQGNLV